MLIRAEASGEIFDLYFILNSYSLSCGVLIVMGKRESRDPTSEPSGEKERGQGLFLS